MRPKKCDFLGVKLPRFFCIASAIFGRWSVSTREFWFSAPPTRMGIKQCNGAALLDFLDVTRPNRSNTDSERIVTLKPVCITYCCHYMAWPLGGLGFKVQRTPWALGQYPQDLVLKCATWQQQGNMFTAWSEKCFLSPSLSSPLMTAVRWGEFLSNLCVKLYQGLKLADLRLHRNHLNSSRWSWPLNRVCRAGELQL